MFLRGSVSWRAVLHNSVSCSAKFCFQNERIFGPIFGTILGAHFLIILGASKAQKSALILGGIFDRFSSRFCAPKLCYPRALESCLDPTILAASEKSRLCFKAYPRQGEYYFDWLIRDVLAYMLGRSGQIFWMPGSNTLEIIQLGDAWQSKTDTAYRRAVKACGYEYDNMEVLAGLEWQKLFGSIIPTSVG